MALHSDFEKKMIRIENTQEVITTASRHVFAGNKLFDRQ